VSFDEALTVLEDPLALTTPDIAGSHSEPRWATVVRTRSGLLVVVFYTEQGDPIRLISARPSIRRERRSYEEDF
jgi:uncharacterized DUF497 family protein